MLRSTVRPWELVDRVLIDYFSSEGAFQTSSSEFSSLTLATGCPRRSLLGAWQHRKVQEIVFGFPGFPWAVEGFTNAAATSFFKFVAAVPAHSNIVC